MFARGYFLNSQLRKTTCISRVCEVLISSPDIYSQTTALYKNIYYYTKTIIINRVLRFFLHIQFNVRSSISTDPFPKWHEWAENGQAASKIKTSICGS